MSDTQKHKKPNVPNLRFPEYSGEWEQTCLGKCCTGFDYGMNAASRPYDGTNKYIRITDIDENTSVYKGEGVVSPDAEIDEQYRVVENDILFARTGASTGKTYIYNKLDGKLYFAGFLIRANVTPKYNSHFVFYQTQTLRYKKWVQIMSMRSGQPGINSQEYSSFCFFHPSIKEQEKIANLIRFLDERIAIQNKVIKKYESLIKALRHHIFSSIDAVNEVKISDILSYEQPTKYLVADAEYSNDNSLTPVLTANKAFILGYTGEVTGIYDKGPCIIFDDFTMDCKIVNFPFKVKSSAIKILKSESSLNLRFIYEYMKFLDLNTEEHKRHYITEIEPMTIEIPSEEIINAIANLFDCLDSRRVGAINELEYLQIEKVFFLNSLFI